MILIRVVVVVVVVAVVAVAVAVVVIQQLFSPSFVVHVGTPPEGTYPLGYVTSPAAG